MGSIFFHNYGHGGARVSLAYGSANLSFRSFYVNFTQQDSHHIAILGCNLRSLFIAHELRKKGNIVTVYTQTIPEYHGKGDKTTTQINDGVWFPYGYESKREGLRHQLLTKLSYDFLMNSYKSSRYRSIDQIDFYDSDHTPEDLRKIIPPFLYNTYKQVEVDVNSEFGISLSKECQKQSFTKFKTFKVDTELLLQELLCQLRLIGGKVVQKSFKTKEDLADLKENIIYNCLECSSRDLFDDQNVKVMKDISYVFQGATRKNYCLSFALDEKVNVRVTSYNGELIVQTEGLESEVEKTKEIVENFVKNCILLEQ